MDVQQAKLAFAILGRGAEAAARVILLAPYHEELNQITCVLQSPSGERREVTVSFKDPIIRCYQFEFANLIDGATYKYFFKSEGAAVELGGGLEPEDLEFTYWRQFGKDDSAVLVSCNGVFDFKSKTNDRWAMWTRLRNEVILAKTPPKLIVHGGDQYYQDSIEAKWLHKLTDKEFPAIREEFKRDALKNALGYLSHLDHRRISARIPSVAMLDDHDITDGAGGRAEFQIGDAFTPEWRNYLGVQLEIFELVQASRNPPCLIERPGKAFSFTLDLGDTALIALDLRTEKNSSNKLNPLMSDEHWQAVEKSLKAIPQKNVLVLLPVVPLRNSIKLEGVIHGLIAIAAAVAKVWKPRNEFLRKLWTGLQYAANLEDDLSDALGSEVNAAYLAKLLRTLAEGAKRGVQYTFLSGDIHTGGSIDTVVEVDGFRFRIPILVSSPVGYQPMHFIVEALLRERKTICFEHDGVSVTAVNNAFTSNRNFMVFYPDRLANRKSAGEAAFIVQENIPGAKSVPINSWVDSIDSAAQLNSLGSVKSEVKGDADVDQCSREVEVQHEV